MVPHIVVIGSLNMDLVVRVPHLPTAGETVLGQGFEAILGGKGANQAVASARLGARTRMIGRVGKDEYGARLRSGVEAEGVCVSSVFFADSDTPSGIAMITLDESGQNTIAVAPGANFRLTRGDIAQAWKTIDHPDVLLLSLEIPLECVVSAISFAQASGVRVVLNPAPALALADDLLQQVDVLVPNETEAALMTDMSVATAVQAEDAARRLLARGVGAVVLTMGSRGALLLHGDGPPSSIPAHGVKVVDVTGAGDAFVAALSVALAEGTSLLDAVRFANAAGAIAVTRLGAQPALPTRLEIEKLLPKNP